MSEVITPGGTPIKEFEEQHGVDAIHTVPSTHIISWDQRIFILDGWDDPRVDLYS